MEEVKETYNERIANLENQIAELAKFHETRAEDIKALCEIRVADVRKDCETRIADIKQIYKEQLAEQREIISQYDKNNDLTKFLTL